MDEDPGELLPDKDSDSEAKGQADIDETPGEDAGSVPESPPLLEAERAPTQPPSQDMEAERSRLPDSGTPARPAPPRREGKPGFWDPPEAPRQAPPPTAQRPPAEPSVPPQPQTGHPGTPLPPTFSRAPWLTQPVAPPPPASRPPVPPAARTQHQTPPSRPLEGASGTIGATPRPPAYKPPSSWQGPPADLPRPFTSRSPAPPPKSESEYSERIDALLSSALAEQSREKRFLIETVYGAKSALVKAQEELKGMREMVAKRDQALIDLIESRLEGIQGQHMATRIDAIERAIGDPQQSVYELLESRLAALGTQQIKERIDGIEEAVLKVASVVSELSTQIRDDLVVSAGTVGDRVGEEALEVVKTVRSLTDALVADLREDAVEVVQTLRLLADTLLADLKEATEASRKQSHEAIRATAGDINETTKATAEAVVEHLVAYLSQRDERMQRSRDQALVELFQQLAENLRRRDRRKLSKAVTESPEFTLSSMARPPQPPPALEPFRAPEAPLSQEPTYRDPEAFARRYMNPAARLADEPSADSSENVSAYLRTSRAAGKSPSDENVGSPVKPVRAAEKPGTRKADAAKGQGAAKTTGSSIGRGPATRSSRKTAKDAGPDGSQPKGKRGRSGGSSSEGSDDSITYRGRSKI